MSNRLHKRFSEMVAEREAEQRRQRSDANSSIGALVVLKQSLVEAALDEMKMKFTKTRKNKAAKSSAGYSHGFAAGGNVNLNRPINDGGSSALLG
ncbi:MAG: hypothetical protein EOP83_34400 [Verrucomicrobiaceae bacterium]|nr:MAG: hypothetical protein EOP83_34400 [Verrucomicrobiaceae bacterium]